MLKLLDTPPSHRELAEVAAEGDLAKVGALIDAGAPLDPPARHPETTALNEAAKNGRLAVLTRLIERGADAQRQNTYGSAPIHVAAIEGQLDCVMEMLEHADVDAPDRDGRTALQEAVQGGHPKVVEALLAAGADAAIADRLNRTALAKVHDKLDAKRPDEAARIRAMLIEAGAPTMHGGLSLVETPLHAAAKSGNLASVAKLLKRTPDAVDVMHFRHGAALHMAAEAGNAEMAAALLEAGGTPLLVSNTCISGDTSAANSTPLQIAASCGHADIVRQLLDAQPDGARNHPPTRHGGAPPIVAAARSGSLECVRLLIDAGAYLFATDGGECTALDRSATPEIRDALRGAVVATYPKPPKGPARGDVRALAKVLVSEGSDSQRLRPDTALRAAVGVRSLEAVERLLRAGAHVSDRAIPAGWESDAVETLPPERQPDSLEEQRRADAWRNKLALFASGLGEGMRDFQWDSEDEDAALERINDGTVYPTDHYEQALEPLHMAAAYDMPRAVSRLIELGAPLEHATHQGETPLIFAARRAGRETVAALLRAGSDPNGRGGGSLVPLIEAAEAGNAPAVDALLAGGADPNVVRKKP